MKLRHKTTAHAFGKIILSGEHAGVYGCPMIAGPITKKVVVTIESTPENLSKRPDKTLFTLLTLFALETGSDLAEVENLTFRIISTLPRKAGLGSSAAYAHAIFKALSHWFSLPISPKKMFDMVQQSEKIFHGNPSGVDAAVTTSELFLQFQKKENGTFEKKSLSEVAQKTLYAARLFAVHSGSAAESTKEMVENVAALVTASSAKKEVISTIGRVTANLLSSLEKGVFPLEFIKENHRLLTALAVVGPTAQKMITEIESMGGVAKITGAGGLKKGSGYLLAAHEDPQKLASYLKSKKWKFFPAFEKL